MDLHIHALSPERASDFFDLFECRAFSDNPDWSGCYCVFNYFSDEEWKDRTAAENRALAARMIGSGAMSGFLAYDGRLPIGWCNAGPKESYKRFAGLYRPDGAEPKICAVTCFVIAPQYRRQGVARALLGHACSEFAAQGYDAFEAYPSLLGGSTAMHYHGYPAMFAAAGFSVFKTFDGFCCMQKPLKNYGGNDHAAD